jgi:hypothetical protein
MDWQASLKQVRVKHRQVAENPSGAADRKDSDR